MSVVEQGIDPAGGRADELDLRTQAAAGQRLGLGRVLVTGGASGLGAAVVRAVAERGGRPICLDVRAADDDIEQEQVDLFDARGAEAAVRRVVERIGGLEAVVTAAGIDRCGRLVDVPGDQWDRVIGVNLLGTAAVVRAALPALTASRGRVVTVASTLGLRALSDATAYCASKFGVVGFTRALTAEVAGQVGVTLLIPGGMATSFFDDRDPQYQPGPDAVLARPQDVAAVVVAALAAPWQCQLREVIVTPASEGSYP